MSDPLLIGAYVFLAVGAGASLWGLRDLLKAFRILTNGGVSVGQVTETKIGKEGEAFITVRFLTDAGVPVQFRQKAPVITTPLFRAKSQIALFNGREYKVFFDRRSPRRASVSPGLDVFYALLMTGLGFMIGMSVYYLK